MMAAHIDKDGGLRPAASDPYTGSADCHGTCAAWYNIACSNILTAVVAWFGEPPSRRLGYGGFVVPLSRQDGGCP